jgi:putative ABC transport system permease protein
MIRNYLVVALRNIRRNTSFSIINIMGLALGMACSMLILLWVQHEKHMDGFHADDELLYSVYERQYHDGQIDAGHYTPGILAEEIKKVIPQIQYSSPFAWNELFTFQAGEKILKENGNHAGPDFFKVFSYPLLKGDAQSALNSPLSIAISRKMSVDFFGSPEQALGKTLRFENRKDLKVTAVFEDLPNLSTHQFEYLINWDDFLEQNQWAKNWGNNGPNTYLKLKPGTDVQKLEAKIKKLLDNYSKDQSANFYIELGLQRYSEMYLHGKFENGKIVGGRIEYVRLFSIVAAFILIIACINFMNLTTARSVKRSKEIGIRKVIGAVRGSLIRQFLGEALLLTVIAFIIAFILAGVLLPGFNSITGKEIELPVSSISFWISALTLIILTGFISGSYPAFMLSAFQPSKVLKGNLKFNTSSIWFRKGLVIFQFTLSVILIIGTIVVSKQVNFLQNSHLGYDRENLVYIPLEGDLQTKYDLFKDQALKQPGITRISCITQSPTVISNGTGGIEWEGKDPNSLPQFTHAGVGLDFIKTMNLTLLDGRDFSKDLVSDSASYLINEAALKIMQLKNPVGSPITFWGRKGKIIGVLKDFHFSSLHDPINPIVIRQMEKNNTRTALVRIAPGKTKQVLPALEKIYKSINTQFPFSYQFSDEEYHKLYKSEEVVGRLSNYFAFLAIFISCLGLLGLAIFTSLQRTREIGIRKVLGASVFSLFTLLSRDFLLLVGIAFMIAAPLAWLAINSWLKNFAYYTSLNGWIFLVAGISAITIALLTVSFQAIRAALANPVKSLKTE